MLPSTEFAIFLILIVIVSARANNEPLSQPPSLTAPQSTPFISVPNDVHTNPVLTNGLLNHDENINNINSNNSNNSALQLERQDHGLISNPSGSNLAHPIETASGIDQIDSRNSQPSLANLIIFDASSTTQPPPSPPPRISDKLQAQNEPSISDLQPSPSTIESPVVVATPNNSQSNDSSALLNNDPRNIVPQSQPTTSPNISTTASARSSRIINNLNDTLTSNPPVESSPSLNLSSTTTVAPSLNTESGSLDKSFNTLNSTNSANVGRTSSSRAEGRRFQDSRSSSTGLPVQFIRPKTKFKCTNNTDCNSGLCSVMTGTCFCAPGFTGESCAVEIDECRQHQEPCANNGTCIDGIDSYSCDCAPGFRGETCNEVINMCERTPCLNDGKCINHRTSYTCECEPGFKGKHCELNTDECQPNPCKNGGVCLDLINDYKCDCGQSGFVGKNCEINFDDCASRPCGINARECIDSIGDFKCICHDGFEGKRCEEDIDECKFNPCENNGTCVQNSIHLRHLFNTTGPLADLSTSYHDIRDQNLSMAAFNLSQYAGYTCECKEEYYGDRCEEKKKCYTKSLPELCGSLQAECINVANSYDCLISATFDGNGQGTVYKVVGDFRMKEIYVKYRSFTGGVIMSFETTQLDSPVADLQLNKSGLYLSGAPIKRDETIKFDELLDGNEREIRLGLDTPTEIKSIILTPRNDMLNDHYPPFKGCLMQVRLNNHLLPFLDYGTNNTFRIIDNHLDVGQCRTCFEKDCSTNGGHCDSQDGYDRCICPETFTGNFCEIDVNECEKGLNRCLNGGVCENTHGGYRCNCAEGYRGDNCKEISDHCKVKQPCITGTCKNVNTPRGYQCECPSTHIGEWCEERRDCYNKCSLQHGHCINNVTCACLPSRKEEREMCEYISSCEQIEGVLCHNGGTCKNLKGGGYYCECQEPYYGPICKQIIEKPHFDIVYLIIITCVGFLVAACAVVSLIIFRSVRKARATRGTYSPSTQEKFGNSACDLLKPPQQERLI